MNQNVRYAAIKPADTGQAAALHRAASRAEQVARSIYSSAKVHHYLASLVEQPELVPGHVLVGAWRSNTLVGYMHGRALERTWHLNEIATLPACQGTGIGGALFARWLATGRERGFGSFSLDVERDNPAVQWYSRHHFEVLETSWAYEKRLRTVKSDSQDEERDDNSVPNSVQLVDWEGAQAWHRAFGFSRFTLTSGARAWPIDRLGRKYFRVREQLPRRVENVLLRMDPRRRLLIVQSAPLNDAELTEVSVSLRMIKGAD